MSLVRFSYTKNPIQDLKNKIRHVYDLHLLLSKEEFLTFFNSKEFDKMLLKVAQDDVISFKNNNKWLKNHPAKSIIFEDSKKVWSDLKTTYEIDFKNLVYGDFPHEVELYNTLEQIKRRISSIEWEVELAEYE